MSLYTGRRIRGYKWHEFPIDDEVIKRVKKLAKDDHQPLLTYEFPVFECAIGVPILDDEQNYLKAKNNLHNYRDQTMTQILLKKIYIFIL